jgi:hypothetical protein
VGARRRRQESARRHLVLAQQRQVQQDLERLSVGGHHDHLGDAAVQRLGRCARGAKGE